MKTSPESEHDSYNSIPCSFLVYQPNQRRKAKSQKGAPENIPGMPLKDYYEIWLVYTW